MMQCFESQLPTPAVGQLLLAHGAGAGSQSDFMQTIALMFAKAGVTTWLFDFPYMQRMQAEGKRRPPDRMPILLSAYSAAIGELVVSADYEPSLGLFIGGKSMGGRVATHMLTSDNQKTLQVELSHTQIHGGVILGYPFQPPGKNTLRTDHFNQIVSPILILQGERDNFGGELLLSQLILPELIKTLLVTDGDHSFKPRKAAGISHQQNLQLVVDNAKEWMCQINS